MILIFFDGSWNDHYWNTYTGAATKQSRENQGIILLQWCCHQAINRELGSDIVTVVLSPSDQQGTSNVFHQINSITMLIAEFEITGKNVKNCIVTYATYFTFLNGIAANNQDRLNFILGTVLFNSIELYHTYYIIIECNLL